VPGDRRTGSRGVARGPEEANLHLAPLVVADVRDQRDRSRRDEFLNAVVVRDVDVAGGVGGDAPRRVELPRAAAQRAPLGEVGAGGRRLSVVFAAVVRDVDVAGGVRGDAAGSVELPVAAARRAPLAEVGAGARELLDAVVGNVHDVDVAGG